MVVAATTTTLADIEVYLLRGERASKKWISRRALSRSRSLSLCLCDIMRLGQFFLER